MKHSTFIQHQAKYILCTIAMLLTFVGTAWGYTEVISGDTKTTGNADTELTSVIIPGTFNPNGKTRSNSREISSGTTKKMLVTRLSQTYNGIKNAWGVTVKTEYKITGATIYLIGSGTPSRTFGKAYVDGQEVSATTSNDGSTDFPLKIELSDITAFNSVIVSTSGTDNSGWVYAEFTYEKVGKHSVTYALNGGSGTTPTQADVTVGAPFTLSSGDGLTKEDNIFDGWNDGTSNYDAGATYTMGTSDVTLTAQWKLAGTSIKIGRTIEYATNTNYVYSNGGNDNITVTQYDGTSKWANGRALYHYTTRGTAIADKCYLNKNSSNAYVKDYDETVFAGAQIDINEGHKFIATAVNVSMAVDQNFVYKVVINDGTNNVYESEPITIANFQKTSATNLEFTHELSNLILKDGTSYVKVYYWLPDLETNKYVAPLEISLTGVVSDVATYTVSYNVNGHGGGEGGYAIASKTGATKLPDTLPTPTVGYGYTFGGWYTDNGLTTEAVPGARITSDVTLYAKWTSNITYNNVNYNANGGSITEATVNEPCNEKGIILPAAYTADLGSIDIPTTWAGSNNGVNVEVGEYNGITGTTYKEVYQEEAFGSGDVIKQSISGLAAGTYEVILSVGASFTNSRGWNCSTGYGLSAAFARIGTTEVKTQIPVIDRGWVSSGEQNKVVLTIQATEGNSTLEYGITNLAAAGNWYIIHVEAINKITTSSDFAGWYTDEDEKAGDAGDSYPIGASTLNLTAKWLSSTIKTFKFDANGGESTVASLSEPTIGQGIMLPAAYKSATSITIPTESTDWTRTTQNTSTSNTYGISYFEVFATSSINAGNVITQSLTGLTNGTYEVVLSVAGSSTNSRDGYGCPTGNNLSVAFAGDKQVYIPVIDRTDFSSSTQNAVAITTNVTDGSLTYGIKNTQASGNWFIIKVLSIKLITQGSFQGWYTEKNGGTRIGGAGDTSVPTSAEQTLYAHWTLYFADKAVRVDHNTTTYTQAAQGSSNIAYSVIAKGDITGASVTSAGVVTWSGDGGALVVVATDDKGTSDESDDESVHYVITVPYLTHTWTFTDDQWPDIKGNTDQWTTVYKMRTYTNRVITEVKDAVIATTAPVNNDNAYYISSTAGLLMSAEAKYIGCNGDMPKVAGMSVEDELNRPYTDATSANSLTMSHAVLTIPSLKKGQHISIKWNRRSDNNGEDMLASNATDLDGTLITSYFQTGNYSQGNTGWEEFIVAEDGDVSFSNYVAIDNGWVNISTIEVGEVDKFLDTDYRIKEYFALYKNRGKTAIQEVEYMQDDAITLSAAYGNTQCMSALTTEYSVKDETRGITINSVTHTGTGDAAVATISIYARKNGYITIVEKAKSNGYVLDYEETLVNIKVKGKSYITQTYSQEYPYTWDLTNISDETKEALSNDAKTNDYTIWEKSADGYTLFLNVNPDYIAGASLAISGDFDDQIIKEFAGLGITTLYDDQVKINTNGGGLQFVRFAKADAKPYPGTLVIPTVPTGYKVYIDAERTTDSRTFTVTSGGTMTAMYPTEWGSRENIYVIDGCGDGDNTKDVVISLQGINILKIGVTKTFKKFQIWDGASYATDCQDYNAMYSFSSDFTHGKFPVTASIVKSAEGNLANFTNVAVSPAYTGTILKCSSVDTEGSDNQVGQTIANVPLFPRDVNTALDDVTGNRLVGVTEESTITAEKDNDAIYIFTRTYYDTDPDTDEPLTGDEHKHLGDLGFYRHYGTNSKIGANKAYLDLSSAAAAKKVFYLWEMFEDAEPTNISETPNFTINYDTDAVYNLHGMKVEKASKGIYIVNGKKVVIK